MTELLSKVLSFISDKLSLRKFMIWMTIFILLWLLTPDQVVEFINSKNFAFLPEKSLFASLCIAISYLIVDFSTSPIKSFFENRAQNKIENDIFYNINSLSRDEIEIIQYFIHGGNITYDFNPSYRAIVKLVGKEIIYQVSPPGTYSENGTYMLDSAYRKVLEEMASEEYQAQDNPD